MKPDKIEEVRCVLLVAWLTLEKALDLGKGNLLGSVCLQDVPTPVQSGLTVPALDSHPCEKHSDLLPLRIH
jgi:hypothetical protein